MRGRVLEEVQPKYFDVLCQGSRRHEGYDDDHASAEYLPKVSTGRSRCSRYYLTLVLKVRVATRFGAFILTTVSGLSLESCNLPAASGERYSTDRRDVVLAQCRYLTVNCQDFHVGRQTGQALIGRQFD